MKRTICYEHDLAIVGIRRAINSLQKYPQTIPLKYLHESLRAAQNAKDMAKRMEARLEAYRTAIESLGFDRKHKKERQPK